MYKIRKPVLGCLVFATEWHPKLMNGARIGVCKEIEPGIILVESNDKTYGVLTKFKGMPFHDFWAEGAESDYLTPEFIDDIVENKFSGKNSLFSNKYNVIPESVQQWRRGGYFLYENQVYSPQRRHDEWSKNQGVVKITNLGDLINLKYSGSDKLFSEKNKLSLSVVQSWIRKGWVIFKGVIYSPIRRI